MKFPYLRYGAHSRPVIPIKIKHDGRSISYSVLVDSGADSCIFDEQVASALGIEVEKGTPALVGGIAGQTATYFIHPVTIEVGGWSYNIQAGFLPLVAGGSNYGVVGQTGFFEHFVVKFDMQKAEVDLKRKE